MANTVIRLQVFVCVCVTILKGHFGQCGTGFGLNDTTSEKECFKAGSSPGAELDGRQAQLDS